MNLMTVQCAGVSVPIPARRASSGTIASVHCSGWTKNPSSFTSTGVAAYVAVVMSLLSPGARLARDGQGRSDARDVSTRQQAVPVEPLEQQLAEVVEP